MIARTIGPSGNGHFALLVTLTGFAAMLASLGLTAGITYEVSRRRWAVSHAFRTSYLAALVLGLAGFLGGLGFFVVTHGTVFKGIPTELAVLTLASIAPALAYSYADVIMLARERYESYAGLELSHSITFLLVGAGLAIPFGLTGAAIGLPAAAAVGALVGAILLAREARHDEVVDRGDSLPRALRFGLQAWGGNLLQQVNYRFDVIVLGGFATARDVGVYSVALTLTGIAWIFPQALQTVLFPRTASLAESAGSGEISLIEEDEALARAVRHGVLLELPTAVLVILLLVIGVPLLYGPSFHETIVLGFILLPGVLVLGEAKILGSAIAGRGKPRYAFYSSLISMPITLALYFILIPLAHARGAAVASTLSYLLTSGLTYFFFRKVARIGLRQAFVPGRADLADYRVAAAIARERLGR